MTNKSTKQEARVTNKIAKQEAEWRAKLTPEQYRITREKGTEPAFTGRYWDTKTQGVYQCVCCGAELFDSKAKYDSGTGWPSFHSPYADDRVETEHDNSFGMRRTEVHCARCDAHLGHVFEDGPQPYRCALLHQLCLARPGSKGRGCRMIGEGN